MKLSLQTLVLYSILHIATAQSSANNQDIITIAVDPGATISLRIQGLKKEYFSQEKIKSHTKNCSECIELLNPAITARKKEPALENMVLRYWLCPEVSIQPSDQEKRLMLHLLGIKQTK